MLKFFLKNRWKIDEKFTLHFDWKWICKYKNKQIAIKLLSGGNC